MHIAATTLKKNKNFHLLGYYVVQFGILNYSSTALGLGATDMWHCVLTSHSNPEFGVGQWLLNDAPAWRHAWWLERNFEQEYEAIISVKREMQ